MLNKIIRYFLENRVITILILVLVVVWGISTSPFNWHGGIIPRNPIPVDAIPDIVNPAKRKAMAVKNEKRFLKQKRNALKNPGYSHHPVKTQASFKRLLKAV